MFSASPVCSCAHSFVHTAHETAGAARIRHSLRPLNGGGRTNSSKPRAQCVARRRTHFHVVPGLTRDPYAVAGVVGKEDNYRRANSCWPVVMVPAFAGATRV